MINLNCLKFERNELLITASCDCDNELRSLLLAYFYSLAYFTLVKIN